jgi:riboflavin synthase
VFTGIVEEIGTVRHVAPTPAGARLEIACARVLERLAVGDRIAVSGVSVPVADRDDRALAVEPRADELARTTLGALSRGSRVNLERAATPSSALAGHVVTGNVDVTARLLDIDGDGTRLRLGLPQALRRYVAAMGYIALDGVSLKVTRVGKTFFEVAVAPDGAERSTLGALRAGDRVNVEADVVARYVERIVRAR